jgi:hypothetical protein
MYQLKAIIPRDLPFDPKIMERVLENVINQTALGVQADFNVTTQTWNRRPTFLIKRTKDGATIYTTNLIYKFVSGGTRVRYATMSPDFQAKTKVAQIMSRRGRGGLAFISRRRPRPGIKARMYPETIGEKWNKELPDQFARAIATEIKAAS